MVWAWGASMLCCGVVVGCSCVVEHAAVWCGRVVCSCVGEVVWCVGVCGGQLCRLCGLVWVWGVELCGWCGVYVCASGYEMDHLG